MRTFSILSRRKSNRCALCPAMIQVLDVLETKPYDVSTLRCVHYASAPMPDPCFEAPLIGWARYCAGLWDDHA
jgi:hypothetical protein